VLPKSNAGAGIGAGLTIVLVYVMQQFAIELGAGHVPIPEAWQWTVPILTALIAGLLAVLTPYYSRSESDTGKREIHVPPDAPVRTMRDK
jgi:hypothetical protein